MIPNQEAVRVKRTERTHSGVDEAGLYQRTMHDLEPVIRVHLAVTYSGPEADIVCIHAFYSRDHLQAWQDSFQEAQRAIRRGTLRAPEALCQSHGIIDAYMLGRSAVRVLDLVKEREENERGKQEAVMALVADLHATLQACTSQIATMSAEAKAAGREGLVMTEVDAAMQKIVTSRLGTDYHAIVQKATGGVTIQIGIGPQPTVVPC